MSTSPIQPLTSEQMEDLRAAFDIFDRDHDGVISICELRAVMGEIGLDIAEHDLMRLTSLLGTAQIGKNFVVASDYDFGWL